MENTLLFLCGKGTNMIVLSVLSGYVIWKYKLSLYIDYRENGGLNVWSDCTI